MNIKSSTPVTLLALSTFLAAVVIIANINWVTGSAIESSFTLTYALGEDVRGVPWEQLADKLAATWIWPDSAPEKYRLLGKLPVFAAYQLLSLWMPNMDAFYHAFIIFAYIFLCGAIFTFGYLNYVLFLQLRAGNERYAELPSQAAIWGCVLFALCPPVLCAFKFPVHATPNDFLGYIFISLALIFLLKEKLWWFCAVSAISVFCRETCLIVLLVFLFFNQYSLGRRFLVASIPISILAIYRLAWPGTYNPFSGAIHNFIYPIESISFLMLVFGVLWFMAIAEYIATCKFQRQEKHPFFRSFPLVMLIVLGIVYALARVREIRIEFILFFQVIPLSILWWTSHRHNLRLTKHYMQYAGLCAFIAIFAWFYRYPASPQEYIERFDSLQYLYYVNGLYIYGGKTSGWIDIFLIHILLILWILPFLVPKYRRRQEPVLTE